MSGLEESWEGFGGEVSDWTLQRALAALFGPGGAGEEEARRQLGGFRSKSGNGFRWLGHLAVQRKRCILELLWR